MAKRSKQEEAALEELERTVFQNFTAAANSISQLYASVEAHQKMTFRAGEQHSMEKLQSWILAIQAEGQRITPADILSYLQNELGHAPGGPQAPHPLPPPPGAKQALTLGSSPAGAAAQAASQRGARPPPRRGSSAGLDEEEPLDSPMDMQAETFL
ncbi:unnamed protein product [Spirodela intermedia]|uniref:Uncharacterized protein n=1 Tax=Spirodela intermedia TaxID=51605 RepID=A0A7I8L1T2_SPIIN|nr:unnamed protein product [Spirodela intermedia]